VKWRLPTWPRVKRTLFYYATHYTWAFVTVMAITLISCAFSIHYLATLESDLKDVWENDVRGGDSVQTASLALAGIDSAVKDLVLYPDKKHQAQTRALVGEKRALLKASIASANPKFYTPRARQAFLATRADVKDFLGTLDAVLALGGNGKPVETKSLETLGAKADQLQKDFDLLIANRTANSAIGISELVGQLRFSLIVTILILIGTVAVRLVLWVAGHPRFNRKRNGPGPGTAGSS